MISRPHILVESGLWGGSMIGSLVGVLGGLGSFCLSIVFGLLLWFTGV